MRIISPDVRSKASKFMQLLCHVQTILTVPCCLWHSRHVRTLLTDKVACCLWHSRHVRTLLTDKLHVVYDTAVMYEHYWQTSCMLFMTHPSCTNTIDRQVACCLWHSPCASLSGEHALICITHNHYKNDCRIAHSISATHDNFNVMTIETAFQQLMTMLT